MLTSTAHTTYLFGAGDNLVWAGIPRGGVFLKLKGEGDDWNTPLYGKDFPVVPFVPPTWGGMNPDTNPGGVNVTKTAIVAFCGPQVRLYTKF